LIRRYNNYPQKEAMSSVETKSVENYMGGKSYKLNPLQSLQIVCTSMICGESQHYRPSKKAETGRFVEHFLFEEFYANETSNDYFDKIVSDALDYDYEACLQFVDKLRNEFYMRLNSNYLLAKATHHVKRVEFNKTHPTVFKTAIEKVGCLPTDWTTQYKLLKESGKPIPTIWKRAIADKLHQMSAYHAAKYLHGSKTSASSTKTSASSAKTSASSAKTQTKTQNPEVETEDETVLLKEKANLVDLIRITHPKPSPVLTELIQTGNVSVADDEQTWEKLRSAKKTWQEINAQIRVPHMALLRNLRGILGEYSARPDLDQATEEIRELTERLVAGVRGGKQFPFRYFSAYKALKAGGDVRKHKKSGSGSEAEAETPVPLNASMVKIALDGLDRCVLESVDCVPALTGRVDCLTDNSGSSRQGMTSEYGTVKVYEIANLSSILTAYRSTEGGSVWIFGDRLVEYPVSTAKSIMEQLEEVNDIGETVGGSTETGVWLFWEKCIAEKKPLNTVFIYSDMQAGTGGLFVDGQNQAKLKQMGAAIQNSETYVDVLRLVEIYRKHNNPKTNLFSVQVAGYDNSILPDILYRGAILSGWTGKEAKLAYEMNALWDSVEQ
jgi:hypothetical protein